MPDRIAIHKLTIGEDAGGNKVNRREIMPGERFTVSGELAAELDSYNPPCCYDPRKSAPPPQMDDEDAIRRVAEPDETGNQGVTEGINPRAGGESNVTREQPASRESDEL